MQKTKRLNYSIFAIFVFVGLVLFAPLSSARAQTNCDTKDLSSAYATADLSIVAANIDEANWTSTTTFVIPVSWHMAGQLLQSPASESFQNAYACVVPGSYSISLETNPYAPSATSVTFSQGNVVLKLVQRGPVSSWLLGWQPPPPWSSTFNHGNIQMSFGAGDASSGQSVSPIRWQAVTAEVNGFQVIAPTPLPSSEPLTTESVWYPPSTKPLSNISFTLVPSRSLRFALASQGGALGYYTPIDVEQFLMSVVLIVFLRWRRQSLVGSDRTWLATRRLCFLIAALSAADLVADLVAEQIRSSLLGPIQHIEPIVISVFGLALVWSLTKWLGRSLAIIAFVSSVFGTVSDASTIGAPAFLFFCWIIILDSIHALFRPESNPPRRLMLLAALIGLASLGFQSGYSLQNLYPGYALINISGCIVAFGIVVIIARTHRQVPLLLEKNDRLLFAVTAGFAMLFVAPSWYIGIHISIAFLVAIATTAFVLSISYRHSLAELAVKALVGKTPDQLHADQRKLMDAERRLDELSKDLKVLENTPLTREQLKRRDRLEKESARLRQWPTDDNEIRMGTITRVNAGLRRFLGLQPQDEQPGVRFPEPAGPADMALALGPGCEPWRNVRKAYPLAVGLILLPVFYYAWNESFVGVSTVSPPYSYFSFITNLCQEFTFWLFPLLALVVAWSSLAGRRGPERAIQIWLCVAIPLIIHSFFNDLFDQSGTVTPILRCALFLIVLVSLGLWLDLVTLRGYRADVTSSRLFQEYVHLNRMAAFLAILVPLVAAGFTIWGQIDSGVLQQKVVPAQVSGQAPSPSASPSGSPSP